MTKPQPSSTLLACLILFIASRACTLPANSGKVEGTRAVFPTIETARVESVPAVTITPTDLPAPTGISTNPPSLTPTQAPTQTLLPSSTPTSPPSATPTVTLLPNYAILRGKVLERSNCRYGPGAPYLYKYGLLPGTRMQVIGRNELGTWLLIQAAGGNNPCWIKASLMEVQGDVMTVEPTYTPLPQSPYYGPPTGVTASRSGNEVTVAWYGIKLRPGDDSEQYPYLIEAWVCSQGQLVFTPVGSYATAVKITDESGCKEASHGRLYAVEKHGYTRWVEIPWPPPE